MILDWCSFINLAGKYSLTSCPGPEGGRSQLYPPSKGTGGEAAPPPQPSGV